MPVRILLRIGLNEEDWDSGRIQSPENGFQSFRVLSSSFTTNSLVLNYLYNLRNR
jgi:hypothetical protein